MLSAACRSPPHSWRGALHELFASFRVFSSWSLSVVVRAPGRRTPALGQLIECLVGAIENGIAAGQPLPAPDCGVGVDRVDLHAVGAPADQLCSRDDAAGSCKG